MGDKKEDGIPKRRGKKGARRVVILALIFSVWLMVAARSSSVAGGGIFTNANLQYIIMMVLNFIANMIKTVVINVGATVSGVSSSPSALNYLASPMAALGTIPLYFIVKKGTGSNGYSLLVSILYLFYSILISPGWAQLLYLGIFPTLFLIGIALYVHGSRILSFIFMLGTIFVVPAASFAVLVFSVMAFYRNWEKGKEGFGKNTFSVVLESVSGFVFVVFFLKYSYRIFLQPYLASTLDTINLQLYGGSTGMQYLSYVFANIMPLAPEFTRTENLGLSVVVMAVVAVIFGLVNAISKKIGKDPKSS